MDLPEVVREALNDESVAAQVGIGGGDVLLVTPSRTLVYRDEGLLSDEKVTAYSHGAERIAVDKGRRKATVRLDYGLDGERTIDLPTKRVEDALHPVLAGVLNRAGVTEAGETVKETFLLSELTVIVTSKRLVRHVGEAVWDEEFDEDPYDDVVDVRFEEGNVATSVVLRHEDRQERFKVPNARARALRECLVGAVLAHHGYDSLSAFREARLPDDEGTGAGGGVGTVDFGSGLDPLSTDPAPVESTDHSGNDDGATEDASAGPDAGASDEAGTVTDVGAGGVAEAKEDVGVGADASAEGATNDDPDVAAGAGGAANADAGGGGRDDGEPVATVETGEGTGETADSFAESGFEPAGPVDDELTAEVVALRERVEAQNELLRDQGRRIEEQGRLFQQLVDELRERG